MEIKSINSLNNLRNFKNSHSHKKEILNERANNHTQNNYVSTEHNKLGGLTYFPNKKVSFGVQKVDGAMSTTNFAICDIEDLTCPSCGGTILTQKQYNEFKNNLNKLPENEYLNLLSHYQQHMGPIELKVFIKAKALSEKYPNATLRQIMMQLRNGQLPVLEDVQFATLNKIQSIATKLKPDQRNRIFNELNVARERIKSRGEKPNVNAFKRKTFITRLEEIRITNQGARKAIIEWANRLPTSGEHECAWIVKHSGKDAKGNPRSSKEIAEKLLLTSVANTDHILARSLGGQNNVNNYVSMHNGCNGEKSNKTLLEWIKENPTRQMYLRQNLKEVQQAIKDGELKGESYQDYSSTVTRLIEELTEIPIQS